MLKAPDAYAAACFKQHGLPTDDTGLYAAMYKPFHLIGLELSISVLSAALRGEPTGPSSAWRGDAVAVAERDLKAGERLDGEGGYTVWGKLVPAATSLRLQALPIGLAHGVTLVRNVTRGAILTEDDVALTETPALAVRRAMTARFGEGSPEPRQATAPAPVG